MNIIVLVTCCYRDEITAQFFRLTRSVPAWFSSLAFVFPLLPASVWHSAHRILIPDLLVGVSLDIENYCTLRLLFNQSLVLDKVPEYGKPAKCCSP